MQTLRIALVIVVAACAAPPEQQAAPLTPVGGADASAGAPDVGSSLDDEPADTRSPAPDASEVPGDAGPSPDTAEDVAPPECSTDAECEAGGECTVGRCVEGACVVSHSDEPCDDGNSCTTGDMCQAGQCAGEPVFCDDLNPCTVDKCKSGECKNYLLEEPQCALVITVEDPARAATVVGDAVVTVSGSVQAPGDLVSLTLGDQDVALEADGSFSVALTPVVGINPIEIHAVDEFGQQDSLVQSFLWAKTVQPAGSPGSVSLLPTAGGFWLDDKIFDDDNTTDTDDLATLAYLLLKGFDLAAVIPDPLFPPGQEPSVGWCTWTVGVSNIGYNVSKVDIVPQAGGLHVVGVVKNLKVKVTAVAPGVGCLDVGGWVTVDQVTLTADLDVSVSAGGSLKVAMDTVTVSSTNVEVDINSGVLQLADFIINWFEDDLATLLENQLESWIPSTLAPMIDGFLEDFTDYKTTLNLPSVLGSSGAPLTLQVRPHAADFTSDGAELTVRVGVASAKTIAHSSPGSLKGGGHCAADAESSCHGQCGAEAASGCWCDSECTKYGDCCRDVCSACGNCAFASPLPATAPLETWLHVDVANQLLYALWRGGHFEATLTEAQLGSLTSQVDVDDLVVTLEPHLPPVVTTCGVADGELSLQLGDLKIVVDLKLLGQPTQVVLFATASARIAVDIEDKAGQNALAVEVVEVSQVKTHLVSVDGTPLLGNLLETVLTEATIKLYAKDFVAQLNAALPIPKVNLGALVPSLSGTVLTLEPQATDLKNSALVITGKVL